MPTVGHSVASFDEMSYAVELGLTQASHTFNAMGRFPHRRSGTAGAVLSLGDVYAQLVADGIHVHPAAMQLIYRAKGPERVVLISDSSPFAALANRAYDWQGRRIFVRQGRCEPEDGTLAGSHALLDTGLRTVVRDAGQPLETALRSASTTPARSIGVGRKGQLKPDFDADVVILDQDLQPVETFVEGTRVWRAATAGTDR